jgi:Divergent InlB B-repeat domain
VFLTGFRSLFRGRASPAVAAMILVGLMLGSGLLAGVGSGMTNPASGVASVAAASGSSVGLGPAAGITPAVQHLSGVFYENDSTYADLPYNETPCQTGYQNYSYINNFPPYTYYDNDTDEGQNCYAGAQSPSTLSLGGNEIGVGYSVLSNVSKVGCSNSPDVETSQVGFQRSFDAGETFGSTVWIGNTSCAYLNELEPSFAVSSDGHIFGALVVADYGNATNTTMPSGYWNRTTDALAFTVSSNNGSSFSGAKTLTLAGIGNIARPVIGAFGKSVYIVYEDINNSTTIALPTPYPYPYAAPIALEAVESTNGGLTWHGPYPLPGMNATADWSAASPSIAVNSLGEIAVAYATNRSCFNGFPSFCNAYGEDIVVSTSTSNGTTWSAPVLVDQNLTGEYQCGGFNNDTLPSYWYNCYANLYQWEPSTGVAWSDVNPNDLYVTWAGGYSFYDANDFSTYYAGSGIFAAASADAGMTWNDSTVRETLNPDFLSSYFYAPTIGVRDGWVYDAYSESNESYCFPSCGAGNSGTSLWLSTSTDGIDWLGNVTLLDYNPLVDVQNAFTGYTSSMGFSSGGPVVTFSDPHNDSETFYGFGGCVTLGYTTWCNDTDYENTSGYAALTTAFVWAGQTTTVNFTETGLPAGTQWNFTFGSATFSTTGTTVQVTNVPAGPGLAISVPYLPYGYWSRYFGTPSTNASPVFTGPTTVTIAYSSEYGITIVFAPSTDPDWDLYLDVNGFYYDSDYYGCGPLCLNIDPEFPWYFPVGTMISITPNDYSSAWPISAWVGVGNGSSTNYGNSTTFTVNGVLNETGLAGAYGSYNVTFVPDGLSAGTTYTFQFNGTPYSEVAPNAVLVAGVVTGSYVVSNIQAAGTAGYEYFGQVAGGDEIYVPATPIVDLNFSYAYVDLGSPPGAVTFEAIGLAAGDTWQMSLNGTAYSSNTPWINVTTRPGTYAVSASPVQAAANDTAQYSVTGFGPTETVAVGSTYAVTYSPTFRVDAISGSGGSITSAGSQWLAPGTLTSFTARPSTNFVFLGWTGTGSGAYTGPNLIANVTVNSPITESASFEALPVARFNLTIDETGLTTGVWWTVDVNGIGYSSSATSLVVGDLLPCGASSYALAVPTSYQNGTSGIQYVASGFPSSTCTTGTTQVTVTFTEQFLVTPVSTGGGTASVLVAGVSSSLSQWVPAGTTAGFEASPATGYTFAGWVGQGLGNYTGPLLNRVITPMGPVTEVASFSVVIPPAPPTFDVDFHAGTSLATGTSWSLTFNGTQYSSTTPWINVSGLEAQSYTLTVSTVYSGDHLTEFRPTVATTSLAVSANLTNEIVDFSTAYFVSLQATSGGSISGGGGSFVDAGRSVALNATPAVGYSFAGWTGTGTGSYSGVLPIGSVVINNPVTEVASFAPIPPPASTSGGLGPSSTALIAGLAVVGLVVGLGAGYLVSRRRKTPPGGSA